MKNILLLLFFALLTFGCGNEDDTLSEVLYCPLDTNAIDTDVKQFFDTELTDMWKSNLSLWFRGEEMEFCTFINSQKELNACYLGSKQIPKMDFSAQTLLVGWFEEPSAPIGNIDKMELYRKKGLYTLTIFVNRPDFGYDVITRHPYWAIFPKLHNGKVHVKINYI